jgi:hypothetical protein
MPAAELSDKVGQLEGRDKEQHSLLRSARLRVAGPFRKESEYSLEGLIG